MFKNVLKIAIAMLSFIISANADDNTTKDYLIIPQNGHVSMANKTTGEPAVSDNGYKLEAQNISGNDKDLFTATGDVSISFKNSVLRADHIVYYPQAGIVEATGNVSIEDDTQQLTADKITYNLNNETGTIDNAAGVLQGEYYICAQSMQRLGKEYYIMDQARISTCNTPLPDWSFSFQRVEAEIDGYLTGDHSTFNIKDMPIMYVPKFIYPLKVTRQTGFLIPRAGYSTELGYIIGENFFWAVDYDKDITAGVNNFSKRGTEWMLEARYAINDTDKIYLDWDSINDRLSPVDEAYRWQTISKSSFDLLYGFRVTVDIATVSDHMYKRDFDSYSLYAPQFSYGESGSNFENVFSEYYNLLWESRWLNFSLYQKNDNKYNDYEDGYDNTIVEQKPSVGIYKYNIVTDFINFDYDLHFDQVSEKTNRYYLDRSTNYDISEYERTHGEISLYKPINLNFVNITPGVTGYYTRWSKLQNDRYNATLLHEGLARLNKTDDGYELMTAKLSLQADVNDIYKNYSSFTHGILNTFSYRYLPAVNQMELPDNPDSARIESDGGSEFGWQLVNYLRGKSWRSELFLKQYYDINEERFLPLDATLSLSILAFSNHTEVLYDHYTPDGDGTQTNQLYFINNVASLGYKDLKASLRYTYDDMLVNDYNTSLEASLQKNFWNVTLATSAKWQANNEQASLSGLSPMSAGASLVWNDQCWSLGLAYSVEKFTEIRELERVEKREQTIEIVFTLKGLATNTIRTYNDEKEY